jgi:hypothetical protein
MRFHANPAFEAISDTPAFFYLELPWSVIAAPSS